jgi:hypothetical protein
MPRGGVKGRQYGRDRGHADHVRPLQDVGRVHWPVTQRARPGEGPCTRAPPARWSALRRGRRRRGPGWSRGRRSSGDLRREADVHAGRRESVPEALHHPPLAGQVAEVDLGHRMIRRMTTHRRSVISGIRRMESSPSQCLAWLAGLHAAAAAKLIPAAGGARGLRAHQPPPPRPPCRSSWEPQLDLGTRFSARPERCALKRGLGWLAPPIC